MNLNNQGHFVNAQIMRKKYPETFFAPAYEDLVALKNDDFVKICYEDGINPPERFWAIVTSIVNDVVKAKVDNDLIFAPFECGELISFEKKCIYDIMKG